MAPGISTIRAIARVNDGQVGSSLNPAAGCPETGRRELSQVFGQLLDGL
jgi:hypothetical protein